MNNTRTIAAHTVALLCSIAFFLFVFDLRHRQLTNVEAGLLLCACSIIEAVVLQSARRVLGLGAAPGPERIAPGSTVAYKPRE